MANEDPNQPATKGDLNELRSEFNELRGEFSQLRGDFNESRAETKRDLNDLRDELIEKMRDMQTEVLRAFHDWARPVDIKLRAIPAVDERLGLIEERVSRLERGASQRGV